MKKTISTILAALMSSMDSILLLRVNPELFLPTKKASVKFSALMVGIKGKIGGTVFQGSKTGFMIKNKPNGNFVKAIKWLFGYPQTQITWGNDYVTRLEAGASYLANDGSNTNSLGNFSAQALITRTSKTWNTLTAEEKAAWTAAAPAFPFTDKWGAQYTGSGFQLYMSINNQILRFSQPLIISPPSASDGDLPTYPWDEIFIAPEASAFDVFQVSLPFEAPPIVAASVAGSVRRKGQSGCLKVVFGGKGGVTPEAARTFELLPIAEMLGLDIRAGGTFLISVDVVNLDNGHLIYRATYPHLVLPYDNTNLFQMVYAGVYDSGVTFNPVKILAWGAPPSTIAFGNIAVDHDSEMLGYLIRIIQLTPNEAITVTKASATPDEFYVAIGTTEVTAAAPEIFYANSVGTFGNPPLIVQFSHAQIGAKSCTVTFSCPTLTAPIVITLTGTGV